MYKILLLVFLTSITDLYAGCFKVKPYQQFATQSSITIMWESCAKGSAKVYYGSAQLGASEANLSQEVSTDLSTKIHELTLTDLEASTTYFYQVSTIGANGKEHKSKIYTFQTAVKADEAFSFSVFSDSQDFPKAWRKISKLVWGDRPNFGIHGGDIVRNGSSKRQWVNHYFAKGHPFLSRIPVYSVLGNHEKNDDLYYQYMSNPDPEYYYSFVYGNTRFFMLDTNKDVSEGSEQYNWLQAQLTSSEETWKFVVHHHPPYSSDNNDHGNTKVAKSTMGIPSLQDLTRLYETYKVDVVFYGHVHAYERSVPLYENKLDTENGVHYICIGGANGHLEEFKPTRSFFTADLNKEHHYGKVLVTGNRLEFKAIDHHDNWFDYLVIEK